MAMLSARVQLIILVMSRLHRRNLFLKVTAKAYDNANIQIVLHLNRKSDTTPTAPVVTSDLTGKATTTDPVEVTTDPNTKVELLDKDGNVIGSGTTDNTGHVMITPTKPIPEGNVTAKAYDNAEHPNSSTSQPKKRLIQRQRRLWLLAI